MILGNDRRAVIENIKTFAESGEFNRKVELNDPMLSREEEKKITDGYIENHHRLGYKAKRSIALCAAKFATSKINRNTQIIGSELLAQLNGGVLITSNHFGPLENTVIRHLCQSVGRHTLGIISQCSNFAMTGALGFLMNYADTIPISYDPHYLARDLPEILKERLIEKKDALLLYPEQEMWFNYRKPRPPKNGAYFYAAKLGVPILSCFVEIVALDTDETDEFSHVRYVLHVLDILYPDNTKSVKENTEALSAKDYALKCSCYEKCYGKKLTYNFENSDIAGWKGTL